MRALRTTVGVLLALLFAVVAPVAVVASWVGSQVDDTDAYVETVGPLAEDEAVQREVGEQLTSTLLSSAGLQGVDLPTPVEEVLSGAVTEVLDGDDFRATWESANRDAHEQLVAVLRGERTAADGDVVVSLADLYNQAAALARAQGIDVADQPEGSLQFRTAPPDRLEDVQGAYQGLVGASTWLPVLAVVLLVLAVAVPAGRARLGVALTAVVGSAITCAVLLAAVAAGGDVAALQVRSEDRALASAIIDALLGGLSFRAWVVLGASVLAALALVVALAVTGRGRARRTAPA